MSALQSIWNDPRRLKWLLTALILLAAAVLGWGTRGLITLDWQRMYRPEEFHSFPDLFAFLSELQTGISPVWSSLEIVSQILFGTTAPFSRIVYPLLLGLVAVLPLWMFPRTRLAMLATAFCSLLFLGVTRILHQGNPQLYDIYFPALLLGYLACLQALPKLNAGSRKAFGMAFAAGLLLAVLELTRTFAIALFPVLLAGGLVFLWKMPRRNLLAFLLPVLLLSGGWHLKQVVSHGHFHWTNHSGFNLQKSWADFTGPIDFEEEAPRYEGGFPNFNTDRHSANNKVVTGMVIDGIVRRPGKALVHAGGRVLAFYRPKTDLYLATLPKPVEWVYRPVVWVLGLTLLFLTGRVAFVALRRPLQRSGWLELLKPVGLLVFSAAGASFLFAIGESGEEARFMISILPLLACLPGVMGRLGT